MSEMNIYPKSTYIPDSSFDAEQPINRRKNPYSNNTNELYGLNQDQLGQRAKSQRVQTLSVGVNNLYDLLRKIATDIIPVITNKYNIGSSTRLWKGVYATNFFTTGGTEILMFRAVDPDNGDTVVAGSNTATLNFVSSDNSVTITGNNSTKTIDLVVSSSSVNSDAFAFFIS